jgi:hypothetical protein
MKWCLEEKYPKATKQIQYGDKVLFLGSCFSQNVYEKGKNLGFNFCSTAYGTLFHPLPIARILLDAINLNSDYRIHTWDNKYFSWDASTKMVSTDKMELENLLKKERLALHENLKKAKYLFLTFGTAKEYRNNEDLVVANCHKVPAKEFQSKLTDLSELIELYESLIDDLVTFNPNLQVVLTVSPVRHSKDGLIQNNRSKARLLQLCEVLERKVNTNYFPSYELVVDQLRDYRFYTSDLVHPSEEAINYVWDHFQESFFLEETMKMVREFSKHRSFFGHKQLGSENDREIELRRRKESELDAFLKKYPEIIWE